jgi:hypothetical protein
VLAAGGDAATIDAAARRVRDERWPEIVAVQQMQEQQGRLFLQTGGWLARLRHWLLPLLLRTGFVQRLYRRHYEHMSRGVVPVRLTV